MKSCHPWGVSTALLAPANCGISPRELKGKKTKLFPTSPPESGGSPEAVVTSQASLTNATAHSVINSAPTQTLSSSCWLQSTESNAKESLHSSVKGFPSSRKNGSNFGTNPINHPDAMLTNKSTNMTRNNSDFDNIENNFSGDHVLTFGNDTCKIRRLKQFTNNFNSSFSMGNCFESKDCNISVFPQSIDATFSIDGGTSVPRGRWESFDSSPPPTFSLKTPLSIMTDLPICSTASLISSPTQSSFSSRSQSPTSAFLDSCLTPRPDEDNHEMRFAFVGRLSGEGRIFSNTESSTSNGLNSEYLHGVDSSLLLGRVRNNDVVNFDNVKNESLAISNSLDPFSPTKRQPSASEAVR